MTIKKVEILTVWMAIFGLYFFFLFCFVWWAKGSPEGRRMLSETEISQSIIPSFSNKKSPQLSKAWVPLDAKSPPGMPAGFFCGALRGEPCTSQHGWTLLAASGCSVQPLVASTGQAQGRGWSVVSFQPCRVLLYFFSSHLLPALVCLHLEIFGRKVFPPYHTAPALSAVGFLSFSAAFQC